VANERRPGLLFAAIVGTVVGLVLVAIVYSIAQVADADLRVTGPGVETPEEVPIANALFFTAVGGVVGLVLASLANRFTARPRVTFLAVCLVLLVLDGIAPFASSEEVSTGIWLNAMHLSAAVPIVGSLLWVLPDRRSALAGAGVTQ
jgi:hypothetical protein